MSDAIKQAATQRGITRLCHFTPSRNLVHIATDPQGVLASQHLQDDDKAVFNPTDAHRFDGFPDHVCCSIEYPNAWYFRKARGQDRVFNDWVVLFIKPHHLWAPGTRFCQRNAAANSGRNAREGAEAFDGMFAPSVIGAYDRSYTRSSSHPDFLPTDEQAEVLIPDRVAREDLLGIGVADESQAKREIARLETLNVQLPRVLVAPDLFRAEWLSQTLRSGSRPTEQEHKGGEHHG